MSRDVRTRKLPVLWEDEATLDDASYDNGKPRDCSRKTVGLVFLTALVFFIGLPLFFFYKSSLLEQGPETLLRGTANAKATATGTVQEPPHETTTPRQWRHPLQQERGLPAGAEQSAPAPSAGPVSMVHCSTTAGPLVIAVHQDWSPHGASRFLDMVRSGFFSTQVGLFRAVRGFLCQTGIAGDPAVHSQWKEKGKIEDDPQWLDQSIRNRMKRGYLSFAGGGKNSRGTEFFFSFRDIPLGTTPWEVPFGTLIGDDSFQTMDHWYTGYGDLKPFGGKAPSQGDMYKDGLHYLKKDYPELDYITSCNISGPAPLAKITIPGYRTVYEQIKEGKGLAVQKGGKVTVHATGVVQQTGKKFWSTKDPGQQPFSYTAGVGAVIVGWDQGLLGSQMGEERKVTIPAEEGYGASGFPAWGIPAGATLEFTLEVLDIK